MSGQAFSDPDARSPLAGVRVLEFGLFVAVPYAASLLGDMGADVIKIEPPGGEPFRHVDSDVAPGRSAYFFGLNRSKRSLVLDLKHEDSRLVLRGLLETADVVLVGYRPDVVAKLGLTYEEVAAVNDRIAYAGLTAWGETGPRAREPGMDLLAQAVGGIMGVTGERDGPPIKAGSRSATSPRPCSSCPVSSRRCAYGTRRVSARRSRSTC